MAGRSNDLLRLSPASHRGGVPTEEEATPLATSTLSPRVTEVRFDTGGPTLPTILPHSASSDPVPIPPSSVPVQKGSITPSSPLAGELERPLAIGQPWSHAVSRCPRRPSTLVPSVNLLWDCPRTPIHTLCVVGSGRLPTETVLQGLPPMWSSQKAGAFSCLSLSPC